MSAKKDACKIPVNEKKKDSETLPPDKAEAADAARPDAHEAAGKDTDVADRIAALENEIEELKLAAADHYDRFLRANAELENVKKRTSREMAEFKKYANERLIKDLLPVVDDLQRAVCAFSDKDGACAGLLEGINLTLSGLQKVFGKHNVEPIEALEKPFDPNFHQAMLQEETDEYPDNTVIREFQKGYMINGRLLRPAVVVVSKPAQQKGENVND